MILCRIYGPESQESGQKNGPEPKRRAIPASVLEVRSVALAFLAAALVAAGRSADRAAMVQVLNAFLDVSLGLCDPLEQLTPRNHDDDFDKVSGTGL